jgi:hypothetical protein
MLGNGMGAMNCAHIRGWRFSPRPGWRIELCPYSAAQQFRRKWAGIALGVWGSAERWFGRLAGDLRGGHY